MVDATYEIQPYETTRVRDGEGGTFLVYHDGDEESVVIVQDDGYVRFGSTSGTWVMNPKDVAGAVALEAERIDTGDGGERCSYPGCGKPTAWLPVETATSVGYQWRHVNPADEVSTHVGYPMPR